MTKLPKIATLLALVALVAAGCGAADAGGPQWTPPQAPAKKKRIPHPGAMAYGDPLFGATADLARQFARPGRLLNFLCALIRRPATLLRVLFAVARLPVVEVCVTSSQAAALFSPDFAPIGAPIFGGKFAQAVLDLEADDQAYLSGPPRQSLRRNMRRARKLGVEVCSVATYREWAVAAEEVLRSRQGRPEATTELRPPPGTQDMAYYVAFDDKHRPVAISVVAIFTESAVLVWSLTVPDHPAALPSRYLLHAFMRSDLRGRGVRHLIGGTGVRDTPGVHLFQHFLGYEVRNLRIRVRDGS